MLKAFVKLLWVEASVKMELAATAVEFGWWQLAMVKPDWPLQCKIESFFWIFYMSARAFSGCHFSSSGRALVSNQLLWLRSLWGILQIPLLSAQPSCILCITFQAWGCSFPVLNAHANVFASKPHTPKWWHLSRFLPEVAQEKMMYMITCRSLHWCSSLPSIAAIIFVSKQEGGLNHSTPPLMYKYGSSLKFHISFIFHVVSNHATQPSGCVEEQCGKKKLLYMHFKTPCGRLFN